MEFEVDPSNSIEKIDPALEPRELAKALSLRKARAVGARHPDAIIIAADSFIIYRGVIMGKPENEGEARRMLKTLSGRRHSAVTGFAIMDTGTGKTVSRTVETTVYMKNLTSQDIDAYVGSGEPLDKAGAYAIQGLGSLIIERIEGDYFNVIGLPLSALAESLKEFGINVLSGGLREEGSHEGAAA